MIKIKAFSWYEIYGLHIARLYASSRVHPEINSMAHFFKQATPEDQSLDLKLNLASAVYEFIQSIPCVVECLGDNSASTWNAMSAHEETLQSILLTYLNSNKGVIIYGELSADRPLRVPVISFHGGREQE